LVSIGKQWNYINVKGEVVATPISDKYYDFNEGVAFFRTGDKIGLLGTDGKLVLEPSYDEIKPFLNGYAKARKGTQWGMIDTKGAVFIPIENEEVGDYNKKGVWVKKQGAFGIVANGKFNPVENVEKIWDFTDKSDLTYARSNKLMGFINNKGEWAIAPKYGKARDFSNGLAPVFMNKKWGYINEKGEQVIDFTFNDAEVFSADGLAPAKDKKWGFIDKTGKWAIQPEYDITAGLSFDMFKKNVEKGFINGLARVKRNKEWGFLNKKGEVLGNKWYQNAELFDNIKE
ncbi:MAG TPA: WG repeat-containing protein, partial [Arenibacter sp.]|nr:WG repeat-containing protein [Arenibacter sp.]